MPIPEHLSEELIKYFFTDESVTARPTGWEVALHTADPGTSGANEVSEGAYTRQSATFASVDMGTYWQASNEADVSFPAAGVGASYTASHFSIIDSVSGGVLASGALPVSIPVVEGTIISFAIGDLIARGTI